MATLARWLSITVIVVGSACGKGSSGGSGGSGSASGSSSSSGSSEPLKAPGSAATTPTPTPGPSKFSYPPAGPGPHEGFDFVALHRKLQGAWLAGGGSIPDVWSLDHDSLLSIDAEGTRTSSTLRLLAPCYYVHGRAEGDFGVYSVFAFDGDTLYLGLGSAGVVQGGKTVACVSSGVYVLDASGCTRWTRKAFAKPGDEWDKEPGDCKYSDDKTTFQVDDSKSSRPLYGIETLKVKGNVLLTYQMENNKAERFPSLDAAIAKHQALSDAMVALTKAPADLPFKSWGLASTAPTFANNARVWAATVTREGRWDLGAPRFSKFENDVVWLSGMNDTWAPSAFVHAPVGPDALVAGDAALLGIGALMPYGRIAKREGDKAVVQFHSGPKIAEQTLEASSIWPIPKGAWTFGAPVMRKTGQSWTSARVVHEVDSDVYVYDGKAAVEKVAKADLRLVDLTARFKVGAQVMAIIGGGMDGYSLAPVTVEKVFGDGVFYTVKAAGRSYDVNLDQVIAKL